MLKLVQLEDGCYRLSVDYISGKSSIHFEKTFANEVKSDSPEKNTILVYTFPGENDEK